MNLKREQEFVSQLSLDARNFDGKMRTEFLKQRLM